MPQEKDNFDVIAGLVNELIKELEGSDTEGQQSLLRLCQDASREFQALREARKQFVFTSPSKRESHMLYGVWSDDQLI